MSSIAVIGAPAFNSRAQFEEGPINRRLPSVRVPIYGLATATRCCYSLLPHVLQLRGVTRGEFVRSFPTSSSADPACFVHATWAYKQGPQFGLNANLHLLLCHLSSITFHLCSADLLGAATGHPSNPSADGCTYRLAWLSASWPKRISALHPPCCPVSAVALQHGCSSTRGRIIRATRKA